ncbi:MAG: LysR family transcriptional regulator [Myxococcota bacterium]
MQAWDDLATFLSTLRLGSASRAAAELDVSVSTVTRRLARLEDQLGKPLFVRTADGMTATEAAHALRPHAEAAEHAVLAGRAAVQSLDAEKSGRVHVALPSDMVQLVLLPVLASFTDAHPDIELLFDTGSGLADLMRREADIAVRVVRPTDGDELVATRLRTETYGVFGSPAYLARHPSRRALDHRWVAWDASLAHVHESRWLAEHAPSARIAFRTNAPGILRQATAAGVGLAVLPRLFGLLTPSLREVELDAPGLPTFDLWMVTHRALRHAPAVAAVWDHLESRLRHVPGQDDVAVLRADLGRAYGVRFDSTENQSES